MKSVNPKLKPPLAPHPSSPDPRLGRTKIILLIAFVLLAITTIGVVVILPDQVRQKSGTQVAAHIDPAPANPEPNEGAASKTRQAQAKMEAEKLLKDALKHQARLENDGIKAWGMQRFVTSYPLALERLAEADKQLNEQRFLPAVDSYRETIALFEQLTANRAKREHQALREGTDALGRLDGEGAMRQFKMALALNLTNSKAQSGLQRARNIERVLELVQLAQDHETNGDLDDAIGVYKETIALDRNYLPAREDLERLEKIIIERKYRRAMSEALSALDKKNYRESQRALDKARRLHPDAPEAHDILKRLKAASLLAEIESLRKLAKKHENNEQWEKALDTYDKVLRIDKSTTFAIQRKSHAKKFSDLHGKMEFYISHSDRLQSPEPLADARKIFDVAFNITGAGPLLREKREQLRRLIEASNTLIPVVIRSNNKTDIIVYQVGHLGNLNEHRLMLRPGQYRARGTRSGHRDVNVRFHVPVSGVETMIEVRCEDQI